MTKFLQSFGWALNGLKTVWNEERNFKIELFFAVAVLITALFFRFSAIELVSILIAIILVLSGEIINTAIEDICNKIEPNQDPVIGKIKDTMAAFVLIVSIGSVILGILIFLNHFFL